MTGSIPQNIGDSHIIPLSVSIVSKSSGNAPQNLSSSPIPSDPEVLSAKISSTPAANAGASNLMANTTITAQNTLSPASNPEQSQPLSASTSVSASNTSTKEVKKQPLSASTSVSASSTSSVSASTSIEVNQNTMDVKHGGGTSTPSALNASTTVTASAASASGAPIAGAGAGAAKGASSAPAAASSIAPEKPGFFKKHGTSLLALAIVVGTVATGGVLGGVVGAFAALGILIGATSLLFAHSNFQQGIFHMMDVPENSRPFQVCKFIDELCLSILSFTGVGLFITSIARYEMTQQAMIFKPEGKESEKLDFMSSQFSSLQSSLSPLSNNLPSPLYNRRNQKYQAWKTIQPNAASLPGSLQDLGNKLEGVENRLHALKSRAKENLDIEPYMHKLGKLSESIQTWNRQKWNFAEIVDTINSMEKAIDADEARFPQAPVAGSAAAPKPLPKLDDVKKKFGDLSAQLEQLKGVYETLLNQKDASGNSRPYLRGLPQADADNPLGKIKTKLDDLLKKINDNQNLTEVNMELDFLKASLDRARQAKLFEDQAEVFKNIVNDFTLPLETAVKSAEENAKAGVGGVDPSVAEERARIRKEAAQNKLSQAAS